MDELQKTEMRIQRDTRTMNKSFTVETDTDNDLKTRVVNEGNCEM